MRARRNLRKHTRVICVQLFAGIHRTAMRDQREWVRVASVQERRVLSGRSGHVSLCLHARYVLFPGLHFAKTKNRTNAPGREQLKSADEPRFYPRRPFIETVFHPKRREHQSRTNPSKAFKLIPFYRAFCHQLSASLFTKILDPQRRCDISEIQKRFWARAFLSLRNNVIDYLSFISAGILAEKVCWKLAAINERVLSECCAMSKILSRGQCRFICRKRKGQNGFVPKQVEDALALNNAALRFCRNIIWARRRYAWRDSERRL